MRVVLSNEQYDTLFDVINEYLDDNEEFVVDAQVSNNTEGEVLTPQQHWWLKVVELQTAINNVEK